MTKLLEKAFKQASKLPKDEQNEIAKFFLNEIESEKRWNELFKGSQSELGKMAEEALAEHLSGKTEILNPEKM